MLFQIAVLQDDKKALERHLKLKEVALVEASNILRSALERALIVEDVQNQNIELKKQMEIYHVSTLADLFMCVLLQHYGTNSFSCNVYEGRE
jgi:hypothetical protein